MRFVSPRLVGVAALLAAVAARANEATPEPSDGVLWAKLTPIESSNTRGENVTITAAELAIDLGKGELVLTTRHPGTQPSEEGHRTRLPLVSIERGRCNTTYRAYRDELAYDGPRQLIVVTDSRDVLPGRVPAHECPSPAAPVEVYHHVIWGLVPGSYTARFTANELIRRAEAPGDERSRIGHATR